MTPSLLDPIAFVILAMFKRVMAWVLFLLAEYCIFSMGVFRVNAVWSYYQLFLFVPAIIGAYLALMPPRWMNAKLGFNARLVVVGCSLIALSVIICFATELVWRMENGTGR